MINKILSFLFPQPSPEEMAKAEQIVEDIIRNNKIAVFSKTYCRKLISLSSQRVTLSHSRSLCL